MAHILEVREGIGTMNDLIDDLFCIVDKLTEREYFLLLDLAENDLLSDRQEDIIESIHFKYIEKINVSSERRD